MLPKLSVLSYWFTSFIFINLLLQHLSLILKRKFGVKLKMFQCNFLSNISVIVCGIFTFYIIVYECEPLTYIYLLTGPVSAFIYAYLNQKKGYTDADINSCQRDTESIGAFWAHQAFDAYYSIVLQDIKDRMKHYENERDIEFLIQKLILVIPLSCDVRDVFTVKDSNIIDGGILKSIEWDQGANVNREFKNQVYEIRKGVYIVAEYPSPLNTLWKIKAEGYILENEKFKYHRDCFAKTLKFLVKDSPCVVIEYDDTKESFSNFLLSALRKKENTILPLQ